MLLNHSVFTQQKYIMSAYASYFQGKCCSKEKPWVLVVSIVKTTVTIELWHSCLNVKVRKVMRSCARILPYYYLARLELCDDKKKVVIYLLDQSCRKCVKILLDDLWWIWKGPGNMLCCCLKGGNPYVELWQMSRDQDLGRLLIGPP